MILRPHLWTRILPLGMLAFGSAISSIPVAAQQPVRIVEGECGEVFGADVCTWAQVRGNEVLRLGATVPVRSIENAPTEGEMQWPPVEVADLAFPDVVQERTGLEYLRMHWEVHGHPPEPYMKPHFDFHFYALSPEETDAIDCSDTGKPEMLPAGYVLPDVKVPEIGELIGLCVPNMGMHALPEEEFAGEEPFRATMVVGYYGGEPIFLEPMITRDMLLQKESFELEVPRVDGSAQGVRYPTRFRADYDSDARVYRLVFSGFPD